MRGEGPGGEGNVCSDVQDVRLCSYQLGPSRVSVPLHAEVWVGLIEHTQQNSSWTPLAAAHPYSATANQTPHMLRAVASAAAAAAVLVVQPGCLAPAVGVSG